MKKILSLMTMAFLVISVMPVVMAVNTGGIGLGVSIVTEDFEPKVWQCDNRIVYDDNIEPGRISEPGEELLERINNYAFTGEQIQWNVLVMDKNGIEKIEDVFATVGDVQGEGNDIEVNCHLDHILNVEEQIDPNCNARILEEELDYIRYENVAAYYTCTLTVEPNMEGEYWTTVEAVDLDGLSGTMAENEYWFFNPVIALSVGSDLEFEEVRPGTSSYSSTILVENDAEVGSGVMLDMFISGTDFYDSDSSGAKCSDLNGNGPTNALALSAFKYFVTSGAYSSQDDSRAWMDSQGESYIGIKYGTMGDTGNTLNPFYNSHEIIQAQQVGPYYTANILAPGAEMAITFRLDLPEPCNGDFDEGAIYFWGEAI